MTHYDIEQWKLFSENLIEENVLIEMQEHLLECEQCMGIYLCAVEEKCKDEPVSINEGFTDKVMKNIRLEKKRINENKLKRKRINIIGCYATASCLTIFLMWSGAFQYFLNSMPKPGNELATTNLKRETVFVSGWTDKLTDSTSNLINNFNLKDLASKNIKKEDK